MEEGAARAAKPRKKDLPADPVREFRERLTAALQAEDNEGRVWSKAKWGVYAFYDYDNEPIYVGQTNEALVTRIRRHLTNQRTDAVAMGILDIIEVAKLVMYPMWEYESLAKKDTEDWEAARKHLDRLEYSVYRKAIEDSRFKAILNEKIPPWTQDLIDPLPPSAAFDLVSDETRAVQGHPDIRLARRTETLSRLAAVAHERGEVSDGLRRVLVIQAVRIAYQGAERLAYVEGRTIPDSGAIDIGRLIGTVLYEYSDPDGATDGDEHADAVDDVIG